MTHNTAYSTNKTKVLELPLAPKEPATNEENKLRKFLIALFLIFRALCGGGRRVGVLLHNL